MKKIIYILLIIFVLSYCLKTQESRIPDNAIRFRIIANSNSEHDQQLKENIKYDLEQNLFRLLENSTSPEQTEQIIKANQTLIEDTIKKYNLDYKINYGENYFPQKTYKGIEYDEGFYKSLVISLGEAKGKNWWCVMYPPLCLLESKSDNMNNVEYKFYFQKILEKLTS